METADNCTNECIAGYLSALMLVADLDDVSFRKMREEVEEAEENDGEFSVASIPRKLDFLEFRTLEDCVNMRSFAMTNAGYLLFEDGRYHSHVLFPEAFSKARNALVKLRSGKCQRKDGWISNLTVKQLLGFDLWKKDYSDKMVSKESNSTHHPMKLKDGEVVLNDNPSESLKLLVRDCPAAQKLIQTFDLRTQ